MPRNFPSLRSHCPRPPARTTLRFTNTNHHQVLRRRRETHLRLPSNIRDSGEDKAPRLCLGRSSDNSGLWPPQTSASLGAPGHNLCYRDASRLSGPPCARFARPLGATSQCSLRSRPRRGLALFGQHSDSLVVTARATERGTTGLAFLSLIVGLFISSSLRCGGRQGSALRSDKLRERTKPFASPLTAFLATAGRYIGAADAAQKPRFLIRQRSAEIRIS